MPDVIDTGVLDQLRESVGGDQAFLDELIDELLADAPRLIATLREAVDGGDTEAARRAAHTLKGNGRTFGAERFSSLSYQLEASAAEGDLDAVRAHLDALDQAWEDVRAARAAARGG